MKARIWSYGSQIRLPRVRVRRWRKRSYVGVTGQRSCRLELSTITASNGVAWTFEVRGGYFGFGQEVEWLKMATVWPRSHEQLSVVDAVEKRKLIGEGDAVGVENNR